MLIGIDSFFDRLDQTNFADFKAWNDGHAAAFAGRNFLGGKFVWAHSEATNTLALPSPWNLPALTVNTPFIAPIQKPDLARQSQSGDRGFLYGQIDGRTICSRIASGARVGEFTIAPGDVVNVWLGVDPDVDFALEYWRGWADTVNSFVFKAADDAPEQRPFAASVLCRYNKVGAQFERDPHVTITLGAAALLRGLDTHCYGFWADTSNPDDGGVAPGPNLDFSVFRPDQTPVIWRFSDGFRDAAGNPVADITYCLDVVREAVPPEAFPPATHFMLKPAKWQPSATNVRNIGFSNSGALDAASVACVTAHALPAMQDFADQANPVAAAHDGHTSLPSRNAKVVGRYLRHPNDPAGFASIGPDELKRLSDAGLSTFVVWERAAGGPTRTAYFSVVGRGTEDATDAFNYCTDVLRVPPHTIIYFTVDYDAGDPNPDPAKIANGESGGPDAQRLINRYFDEIAVVRDAHAQTHPDRPYEIGVYAPGKVLEWCYARGVTSGFWHTVSSGATGNAYGTRPWGHATRWQYQGTFQGHPLPNPWPCAIAGSIDPDADWGDGGQWNQNDRPALTLTELEDHEKAVIKAFLNGLMPGLAL